MDSNLAAAVVIERLVRSVYAERGPQDLPPLQWSILRHLYASSRSERTVGHIATAVNVTQAPISRALASLIRRGLVVSSPHPRDARSNIMSLTDLGVRHLRVDPLHRISATLDRLPTSDQHELQRILALLLQRSDISAE